MIDRGNADVGIAGGGKEFEFGAAHGRNFTAPPVRCSALIQLIGDRS
jgi:hypothetical protein